MKTLRLFWPILASIPFLHGCIAYIDDFDLDVPQPSATERIAALVSEGTVRSGGKAKAAFERASAALNRNGDVQEVSTILEESCPNDGWALFVRAEARSQSMSSLDARDVSALYRSAHLRGVLPATVAYGRFLQRLGTPLDMSNALQCFERAADRGDFDGMFELGRCFEHGFGVDRNIERAFDLYEKAANGGHLRAIAKMAAKPYYSYYAKDHENYVKDGENQSIDQSVEWGNKLVSLGCPVGKLAVLLGTVMVESKREDRPGREDEVLAELEGLLKEWVDNVERPKKPRPPGFIARLTIETDNRQETYDEGAKIVQFFFFYTYCHTLVELKRYDRVSGWCDFLETLMKTPAIRLFIQQTDGEDECRKDLEKWRLECQEFFKQKREDEERMETEERVREEQQRSKECLLNVKAVELAIEKALQDGTAPNTIAMLVRKGYLPRPLRCPSGKEDYIINLDRIDPVVCPNGHRRESIASSALVPD